MTKIRTFRRFADWLPYRDSLLDEMRLPKSTFTDAEYFSIGLAAFGESGEVLSVCALYDNPHLMCDGKPATCFGHFDCKPDTDAPKQMLQTAANEAEALGKKWLIGPMNGSTWGQYRLPSTELGFMYLLDVPAQAHYAQLLQEMGFEAIGHYTTHLDEGLHYDPERLSRAQLRLNPLQLSIRAIDTGRYEAELAKIHAFSMDAFAQNVLFSPISLENFKAKYLPLKDYICPDLVLIAENRLGEMKGFIFAVPNFLDMQYKGMIVKTIAIKKGHSCAGLATLLGAELYKNAVALGFQYALHAFMESCNKSVNLSRHFNGKIVKEYQLWGLEVACKPIHSIR